MGCPGFAILKTGYAQSARCDNLIFGLAREPPARAVSELPTHQAPSRVAQSRGRGSVAVGARPRRAAPWVLALRPADILTDYGIVHTYIYYIFVNETDKSYRLGSGRVLAPTPTDPSL